MEQHYQHLYDMLSQVDGYIYPNELHLQWGILIVLYPYLTGLVAGAFILASLERVFKVKVLKPSTCPGHGPGLSDLRSFTPDFTSRKTRKIL
jgi:hypothetical protein